jgi:WD40 repeat protein
LPDEPPPKPADIRLEGRAEGEARVYLAGRDLHVHHQDGVRGVRRTKQAEVSDDCPYPGLAAFDSAQADWFFGRDRLSADLVERLKESLTQGSPLMVVAPSGAGKSSLLQAGLLPALTRGALPVKGSRYWPHLVFTPTAHPMQAAFRKIGALGGEPVTVPPCPEADHLNSLLRSGLRAQARAGAGVMRAVIVVDQFEELFTLCSDEPERRAFIDWLWQLSNSGNGANSLAVVVCGLRADFYPECADYLELRDALQANQVVVGPMSEDELREAILYPAREAGLDVEPGLAELLLRDLGAVGAGSDASEPARDYQAARLPLLAHALQAMWQQRHGSTLTVDGYRTTGGIHDAIAKTAERDYDRLDPVAQQEAHILFLRLIKIGDSGEDVRRPLSREELFGGSRRPDTARAVIDVYTASRLVTRTRDNVQITHEALIRAWPRLRQWIDEDRAGNLRRQELEEAAAAWERGNRDKGTLYLGSRLEEARRLAASPHSDDLSPVALAFLAASNGQERRAVRLRRGAIAALTVLALLASATAAFAFRQRATAQAERDDAIFGQITSEADALLGTDVSLAAQLNAVAYRWRPTHDLYTRLISMAGSPLSTPLTGAGPVYSVGFSRTGQLLAVGTDYGKIQLWRVASPGHPVRLGRPLAGDSGPGGKTDSIYSLAFSPGGHILATGDNDGEIRLWDLTNAARPSFTVLQPANGGGLWSMAFSPDGHTLASGSADGRLRLWNLTNLDRPRSTELKLPNGQGLLSMEFSPDGHTLAAGTFGGTLRLWEINGGGHRVLGGSPVKIGESPIYSVAFAPDGHTLASGGGDLHVHLWNVRNWRHPVEISQPASESNTPVHAVAFSPDGRIMASSDRNAVQLWSISSFSGLVPLGQPLTGHSGPIISIAFGADSHTLATGSADGTTRLWTLPPDLLVTNTSIVRSVAFSPRGHLLASGSQEGTIQLWNVADPARPVPLGAPVHDSDGSAIGSVAFSPDGRILADGDVNGAAQLWSVAGPGPPAPLGVPVNTLGPAVLAFSPRGHVMATGSQVGWIQLWNVADPAHPVTLGPPVQNRDGGGIEALAFSPDGHTLADGDNKGAVQLEDVSNPAHPTPGVSKTITAGQTVFDVAFSHDGRILATGGEDDAVQLWSVAGPTRMMKLGHALVSADYVASMMFSPDGRVLANAVGDGTIRLWDITHPAKALALGRPLTLGNPSAGSSSIFSVAFSPDGRVLASGSIDGAVRLLPMSAAQAIRWICTASPDVLTRQLWHRYMPELPFNPPCAGQSG